jgi:PleD family two-component response regulator
MKTAQLSNFPLIESHVSAMDAALEMKERAKAMLEHDFLGWDSDRVMALVHAIKQAIILREDQTQLETQQGTLLTMASFAELSVARPVRQQISRILIVDDNPFTFAVLEDAFEGSYEVMRANNGLAALNLAAEEAPDLILLDVMMPGMNGYDVCRRLKSDPQTSNIPVIFITGLGDLEAETRGLELGAVDYITKPLNPASVKARVNNQVQLKKALDKLTRLAELEQSLRDDILEVLEFKLRA